jgi:co-chaperonin GroES (HSP10)
LNLAHCQPINDRVIVRRLDDHSEVLTTSAGSFAVVRASKESAIVLAEPEKEISHGQIIEYENMTHRGEVIAVGPGKWMPPCKGCGRLAGVRRPVSVKVGDIVHFGRFVDLREDGLCVMQEDDIVGIEEECGVSLPLPKPVLSTYA